MTTKILETESPYRESRLRTGVVIMALCAALTLACNSVSSKDTKTFAQGETEMAKRAASRKPNILLITIDSLKRSHMSCYGYPRLTTPHMDRFAQGGTLFENTFSPNIPTTPAYAAIATGRDCFGMRCVALRHKGGLRADIRTLPEILREAGYESTCVGFKGNPASRGYDNYLGYEEVWGDWEKQPLRKAERLNDVTIPEIERLTQSGKPWFVMLRHMDPHAPYLPPSPFDRMFYHGNEFDPANKSMEPIFNFKPFCDFFASWMPPGVTDKDHIIARYDGAIAYMDSCIARIFTTLEKLGILDDTIVVINSDHGETLYEHDCYFDHHGMYENTLQVPLIIRYPKKVPAGLRIKGYNQHKDIAPTILELAGVKAKDKFEGRSLMRLIEGKEASFESSFYITECTWMRKHGWRTPEWKLMIALEPDFHFKPEVELYNLVEDPGENNNLAKKRPDVVERLRAEMNAWIARREKEEGITNPMLTQGAWHGIKDMDRGFESSQEAYDRLHIGSVGAAQRIQAGKQK